MAEETAKTPGGEWRARSETYVGESETSEGRLSKETAERW